MKRKNLFGAASILALIAGGFAVSADAQGQQAIVIQGGTLVDGNGGAPIPNSVIVIQGNRIVAAGRAGAVRAPAGAQVIDAKGKWITPGLIDAKSGYFGFYGEAYLMWGVTSAVSSGGRGDVGQAERDAINHGLLTGPRLFQAYATIDGPGPDLKKPDRGGPGTGTMTPHSVEEAHAIAAKLLDVAGADIIGTDDGNGPPEIFAAVAEEAHKRGKGVVMRAVGPQTRAHEAALAGADVLIHTGEVGVELAKDPEKWKDYIALPPDAYSDMDPAKVSGVVKFLVDHHVALEPDLMATDRGFHKNWKRVQDEDMHFFSDPNLLAYYPKDKIAGLMEDIKSPETYMKPADLEVRARGFANHMIFLNAFVKGGGHLVAASDIPQSPPGLGVQQEMTAFQEEAGVTPMQALQAGSKWVADGFRLKDLGTIETGKFADLVIVDADPTVDIKNMRKIDTVIKDGKIVDRTYHANFKDQFLTEAGRGGNPIVEDAAWARMIKTASFRPNVTNGETSVGGEMDTEIQPTPGIEAMTPYVVEQNSAPFTLDIKGFNFTNKSQVLLNGKPVPAKVLSQTEIQVNIGADILANAATYGIHVKNQGPLATEIWGGTSNRANLIVPYAFSTQNSHNQF